MEYPATLVSNLIVDSNKTPGTIQLDCVLRNHLLCLTVEARSIVNTLQGRLCDFFEKTEDLSFDLSCSFCFSTRLMILELGTTVILRDSQVVT